MDCSIVHSFSNVEAKIESAMVASTQNEHELTCLVLSFAYLQLRVFLLQLVRIEQGSFVSHMLTALTEMLREVDFGLFFKNLRLMAWNAVPKFRLALMKIID